MNTKDDNLLWLATSIGTMLGVLIGIPINFVMDLLD